MSSLRATPPRLAVLAVLAASGALLAACDANPIGGGTSGTGGSGGDDVSSVSTTVQGGGSPVGTSSSSQGTGGAGTGGADAVGGGAASDSVALYGDEIPESDGGDTGSTGVGGGSGFEDDRLYLFVSDAPTACDDPFFVDESCPEQEFRAVIGLPPEYQTPGVYDLDDPAIISNFSEWGPSDGGECQGGGGSFWDGTIEVIAIESDRVRVVLAGTSPENLDGAHAVYFCNAPPVDDSAVIAYFSSDLPEPGSGSAVATSGTSGGEELLHIRFADHGQSCADPGGPAPGPGETHHEFIVAIPQSYLTPGTYQLDDAAIVTSYYEMEENTAAVSGGGGTRPGALTILSVTDDTLEIELTGSQYDFANGGGLVPRCGG